MNDLPSSPGPANSRLWLLVLAALVAWQGWQTVAVFGGWEALVDARPLLSGRHPLHLYHGYLGARSLLERGSLSCFDPAFHAGYPKTPVFDSGSRPAELALALSGGGFRPASYKWSLALLCLMLPLAAYTGARGLGLERSTATVAVLLSLAVWWGKPGREALQAGDGDLLWASVLALAQAGLLVRYYDRPCPLALIGAVVVGLGGWFAHPLLMIVLLPPFMAYYLVSGPGHGVAWHAPLFAGMLVAVAGNAFWLVDLVSYWWVRVPPELDTPLVGRSLGSLWRSVLWGGVLDRVVGCALLLAAAAGLAMLRRRRQRVGANLIGSMILCTFLLSVAGLMLDVLGRLGACQLVVPALLFACLPCALAVCGSLGALRRRAGIAAPFGAMAALCAATWLLLPPAAREQAGCLLHPHPLEVGLGQGREALVASLKELTTDEARILWEDRPAGRGDSRWTALLPLLTGRAFVGGLDAGAGIEHTATGLVAGKLAGQPLEKLSDSDLEAYCDRYNIGWIVTWSDQARTRFTRWKSAHSPTRSALPGTGASFWTLSRGPSFARSGKVKRMEAGPGGILLCDAQPRDGQILLSLHYQRGMKVSPARVKLEESEAVEDKIPFVRLILTEPAGRILITWDGR